jgi:hypothetical protein
MDSPYKPVVVLKINDLCDGFATFYGQFLRFYLNVGSLLMAVGP